MSSQEEVAHTRALSSAPAVTFGRRDLFTGPGTWHESM